jgi:hypothetical protein
MTRICPKRDSMVALPLVKKLKSVIVRKNIQSIYMGPALPRSAARYLPFISETAHPNAKDMAITPGSPKLR